MSVITNYIGVVKELQRAIGRERSYRLLTELIAEDSDEEAAYLVLYQHASILRYLLQLAEDERWLELISVDEPKLPWL